VCLRGLGGGGVSRLGEYSTLFKGKAKHSRAYINIVRCKVYNLTLM